MRRRRRRGEPSNCIDREHGNIYITTDEGKLTNSWALKSWAIVSSSTLPPPPPPQLGHVPQFEYCPKMPIKSFFNQLVALLAGLH